MPAELKIRKASLLHRLLGITPGYAPAWLWSHDACLGIDILNLIGGGAVLITLILGQIYSAWIWLIGIPFIVCWLRITLDFEKRERLGRSRLRRGECVWCGRSDTPSGVDCPACHRQHGIKMERKTVESRSGAVG